MAFSVHSIFIILLICVSVLRVGNSIMWQCDGHPAMVPFPNTSSDHAARAPISDFSASQCNCFALQSPSPSPSFAHSSAQAPSSESSCGGFADQTARAPSSESSCGGFADQTARAPSSESSGGGFADQTARAPSSESSCGGFADHTARAPSSESSFGGFADQTARAPSSESSSGGFADQTARAPSSYPSVSTVFFALVSTSLTVVICVLLYAGALEIGPPDEVLYTRFICLTPGVHAFHELFRLMYYSESSRFVFTCLEAIRETYSALAVVCFMLMLDTQLKAHYRADRLGEILQNKLFTFHYPLGIFEPTVYRTTKNILFWMRVACYQTFGSTLALYCMRIVLEHAGVFTEIHQHIFQVVFLMTSSLGTFAVYAYAQGVDADITEKRMVEKIGRFKLIMFLVWFQGPGIDLLEAVQAYLILTSLLCYVAYQLVDILTQIL